MYVHFYRCLLSFCFCFEEISIFRRNFQHSFWNVAHRSDALWITPQPQFWSCFLFFSVRVYLNQFVFLFSLDDYVCFQPLIFSQPPWSVYLLLHLHKNRFSYFYRCIDIERNWSNPCLVSLSLSSNCFATAKFTSQPLGDAPSSSSQCINPKRFGHVIESEQQFHSNE